MPELMDFSRKDSGMRVYYRPMWGVITRLLRTGAVHPDELVEVAEVNRLPLERRRELARTPELRGCLEEIQVPRTVLYDGEAVPLRLLLLAALRRGGSARDVGATGVLKQWGVPCLQVARSRRATARPMVAIPMVDRRTADVLYRCPRVGDLITWDNRTWVIMTDGALRGGVFTFVPSKYISRI